LYRHNAFQITHLHTTVINSGRATQLATAHTVVWGCAGELASALTAAAILADVSVTQPSPKLPKMCPVGR